MLNHRAKAPPSNGLLILTFICVHLRFISHFRVMEREGRRKRKAELLGSTVILRFQETHVRTNLATGPMPGSFCISSAICL